MEIVKLRQELHSGLQKGDDKQRQAAEERGELRRQTYMPLQVYNCQSECQSHVALFSQTMHCSSTLFTLTSWLQHTMVMQW